MKTLKQWAAEDQRLEQEANLSGLALMEHRWKATREHVNGDKPRFSGHEYARTVGRHKDTIRQYALGWELYVEDRDGGGSPPRLPSEYVELASAGEEQRQALKIVAAEEDVSLVEARKQHKHRVTQVATDLHAQKAEAKRKDAEAAEEAADLARQAREAKDEAERAEAQQHHKAARKRADQARKDAEKAERDAAKRAEELQRIKAADAKLKREEDEKRRRRAESDSWVKFMDELAPKFDQARKQLRSAARITADAESRVDEREFLDWIEEQVEKVKQAADLVLLAAEKQGIDWDAEFAKLSE